MSATCGAPAGGGGSGAGGGTGFGGSGGGSASGGTGASGGGTSFGGSGGEPGSGGSGAVGGSGSPPPPETGCSSAPDCDACADCVARCTCLTGDSAACLDACAPYAPPGGGSAGDTAVSPERQDNEAMSGGCTCRAAPASRAWSELVAAIAALALGAARRRRRQCEVM
jgi:MYXO-CTERM domain-containing protein